MALTEQQLVEFGFSGYLLLSHVVSPDAVAKANCLQDEFLECPAVRGAIASTLEGSAPERYGCRSPTRWASGVVRQPRVADPPIL